MLLWKGRLSIHDLEKGAHKLISNVEEIIFEGVGEFLGDGGPLSEA